jgi:hypothetical protein
VGLRHAVVHAVRNVSNVSRQRSSKRLEWIHGLWKDRRGRMGHDWSKESDVFGVIQLSKSIQGSCGAPNDCGAAGSRALEESREVGDSRRRGGHLSMVRGMRLGLGGATDFVFAHPEAGI